MHQYIVIAGNLGNGFQFFGPWSLEQKDKAEEWAEEYTRNTGIAAVVTTLNYAFQQV